MMKLVETMVKKSVTTRIYYVCETCGSFFETQTEAICCEKQPPRKKWLDGIGDTWQVGDFVVIIRHDHPPQLGRISATRQDEHRVEPILDILGRKRRNLDSYDEEFILVTEAMKKQILQMADLIREEEARKAA